jgi:hypothetical protein
LVFTKIDNRRAKQVLPGSLVPVGGGRRWGEDIGGRIWCLYCVHMYVMYVNGKVETIPGMVGEEK